MAQTSSSAPTPTQTQSTDNEDPTTSLSPSAQVDLAITLILNSWPALTLAVQSSWGGPTSSEKRDWFCGAIADLFSSRPDTDAADVEEVLLQVMNDEFDVVVDDGSAGETADRICDVRGEVLKGQTESVKSLWQGWKAKSEKGARDMFKRVETRDEDQETDDEWEDEDEDDDVEMGDAPAATRPPRERIEPEVDEEGFTKVVGKNKR